MVAASTARPAAVRATPIHSRRVTSWPKRRSAATVSRTSPPAITVCTSEIGASDSAPTCRPHEAIATSIPIVYVRERKSTSDERRGRRQSTSGDSTAPRALSRKPTIDANAVASARRRPSCTESAIGIRCTLARCSTVSGAISSVITITHREAGRMSAVPHAAAVEPGADDVQPVEHETRDRIITGLVTGVPFVCLGLVVWQVWASLLGWSDIAVFAIMYVGTGLGITVGFHRHLTHRAFATTRPIRAALAVLGSAAIEGPVISWVADHRRHHVFSDQPGDPHSPHVDHGGGLKGQLRGLAHAHMGWLFIHTDRGSHQRYAPDLLDDPIVRTVDRTFIVWAVAGLAVPFGLGVAIGGSVAAGLTGLLWGGAVRLFLLHHITYSVNSLCHTFGRQSFETKDESRNLAWLALPTFGEAWHNNHHAFPTSAVHGLGRWQVDPSALVIRGLEKVGLVWDVVKPTPARQAAKAASAA